MQMFVFSQCVFFCPIQQLSYYFTSLFHIKIENYNTIFISKVSFVFVSFKHLQKSTDYSHIYILFIFLVHLFPLVW